MTRKVELSRLPARHATIKHFASLKVSRCQLRLCETSFGLRQSQFHGQVRGRFCLVKDVPYRRWNLLNLFSVFHLPGKDCHLRILRFKQESTSLSDTQIKVSCRWRVAVPSAFIWWAFKHPIPLCAVWVRAALSDQVKDGHEMHNFKSFCQM